MPDYRTMQQDAVKRALEMQSRAQQNTIPPQTQKLDEDTLSTPFEEKTKSNIFEILFKDSEKTLIIILILIFLSEDCDISLLIALLYLIL